MRNGIYSLHDCKVLTNLVQSLKPKTILDLGPREGRTTSVILEALSGGNLSEITYYLFEKDENFYGDIKSYCEQYYSDINFVFNKNILDFDFSDFPQLDLCFIDGNHDYILAQWYIDTLFPLVKQDGVIHVHDIHYGRNGNGWDGVGFQHEHHATIPHPDIVNRDIHKRLYPRIFDRYSKSYPISIMEADIVRDYCIRNKERIKTFSTCYPPQSPVTNCWCCSESRRMIAILRAAISSGASDRTVERQRLDLFESKILPVLVRHCYECHAAEVGNCSLYIYGKEYEYFTNGS